MDPFGLFNVVTYRGATFSDTAAYYRTPEGKTRRVRENILWDIARQLENAIDSETDCECKEMLQNIYDNWIVKISMSDGVNKAAETHINYQRPVFTPYDVIGNSATGGTTVFYNEAFSAPRNTAVHEYGHMLPGVVDVRQKFGNNPNEAAANQMEAYILDALTNGRSLCQ